MTRLAFIGRDGVLFEPREDGIYSPKELRLIPGSAEAIGRLNHAGYKVAVVTNQPALATGTLDIDGLNAIHARLNEILTRLGAHLEALLICPHSPDAECDCRKPRTALFEEIGRRLAVPLAETPLFGDDVADVEAAFTLGARPYLVATGNGRRTHQAFPQLPLYEDLAQAVARFLDAPP